MGGVAKYASRADIEEAILEMDGNWLQCRANNHAWQAFSAPYDKRSRTYEVTQQCIRCESFRHCTLGETGAMLARWHIAYAEGYLLKGMGRAIGEARDALRFAATVRISDNAPARHRRKAG